MGIRARWVALLALLVGVGAAFGLLPQLATTQEGVIVIGTTDGITTLDVADSYDYWTWHVFQNTAQGLVGFERGTGRVVPELAESVEVSEDGTVYTFKLRKGVKFWDGADFNADAVVFSLNRSLTLRGPAGAVDALMYDIVDVQKLDDYTVQITIERPDATFLPRLAGCACAFIMSPKSTPADRIASGDQIEYAGTGPYKLAEWVPDVRTVYEAFPEYWNKDEFPRTPTVITQFFPEGAAPQLAAAVRAGDIDVAFHTLNPEDVLALREDPNVNVIEGESLNIRYMVINVTRAPFDDVRVRRAIALAVDRQAIVDKVFLGINEPLYSMVPPGFKDAYVKAFPDRDVEAARQLVEAYAADTGAKLPLEITLTATTRYGDTERDVAVVVARSLEETGVFRVNLEILERVTFFDRLDRGELDFLLLGWYPDFIDPDNFLGPWLVDAPKALGTFFDEHPRFAEYKALFDQARSITDPARRAERMEIYKRLQRMVAEDVPLVPLWLNKLQNIVATGKDVKGVEIDVSAILRTWLIYKE